jgi:hypothetical protein
MLITNYHFLRTRRLPGDALMRHPETALF